MNKKYLNVPYYIWGLFLFSAVIFIFFPQIDLYISGLFYDDGFRAKGTFFELLFYHSIRYVILFFAIGSLLLFFYNLILKKNILNMDKRVTLYLFLVLSLAPGLIVNVILKDNWQRARPQEVVQFGGEKKFTPAYIISDQNGYSFSSGHAAAAFSLLGFALLATQRRKFWIALALSYGVLMSLARIAAGGHFFSDTVVSFFIVYTTTYILYSIIIKENKWAK